MSRKESKRLQIGDASEKTQDEKSEEGKPAETLKQIEQLRDEFDKFKGTIQAGARESEKLKAQIEEIMTQFADMGTAKESSIREEAIDQKINKAMSSMHKTTLEMDQGYEMSFLNLTKRIEQIEESRAAFELPGELKSTLDEMEERISECGSELSSLSKRIDAAHALYDELKRQSKDVHPGTEDSPAHIERMAKLIRYIEEKVAPLPTPSPPESIIRKQLEEAARSDLSYSIEGLLDVMIAQQANVLHIQRDSAPLVKLEGELIPLGDKLLTDIDCAHLILPMLNPDLERHLANREDILFTTSYGNATFKFNVFIQRKSIGATVKMLPLEVPSFRSLGMPEDFKNHFKFTNGLILISGLFGSGKTSTAAAIIDYFNSTRKYYIITLENPIEFVHHKDKLCLITQREWGTDFFAFGPALSQSLNKDPDVIYIGELSDPETLMSALIAADSGHLILSTMLGPDSIRAVERIAETFTGEAKRHVQRLLARVLRLIVSVRLVDTQMGGKCPAVEVLVNTPEISRFIQENRPAEIYLQMERGRDKGMRTFTQTLGELRENNTISHDEYEQNMEALGFPTSTVSM